MNIKADTGLNSLKVNGKNKPILVKRGGQALFINNFKVLQIQLNICLKDGKIYKDYYFTYYKKMSLLFIFFYKSAALWKIY